MMNKTWLAILFFAFVLVTDSAEACSVCFGATESDLKDGINYSILFMLGITYVTVGGFAGFFVYLRRRERLFTEGPPPAPDNFRRDSDNE